MLLQTQLDTRRRRYLRPVLDLGSGIWSDVCSHLGLALLRRRQRRRRARLRLPRQRRRALQRRHRLGLRGPRGGAGRCSRPADRAGLANVSGALLCCCALLSCTARGACCQTVAVVCAFETRPASCPTPAIVPMPTILHACTFSAQPFAQDIYSALVVHRSLHLSAARQTAQKVRTLEAQPAPLCCGGGPGGGRGGGRAVAGGSAGGVGGSGAGPTRSLRPLPEAQATKGHPITSIALHPR